MPRATWTSYVHFTVLLMFTEVVAVVCAVMCKEGGPLTLYGITSYGWWRWLFYLNVAMVWPLVFTLMTMMGTVLPTGHRCEESVVVAAVGLLLLTMVIEAWVWVGTKLDFWIYAGLTIIILLFGIMVTAAEQERADAESGLR